ncbi:MAG: hypothetical protein PHR77_00700 [Kiritimatiellae bacterium]|nr:hypothetical protein [Kiritimatiellia bacterium]MDD5522531.1 hypothetical protein [Kiritimatiellia bacterium]
MSEKRITTAGNSIIIGELRKDIFCITTRAGLVRQVSMHTPVSQRARFMDELFCDNSPYLSFSLSDEFNPQLTSYAS